MNFSFATGFAPESKVWIYQANREFKASEVPEIDNALATFTRQWTAHNHQLTATGKVVYNRFIILVVDESHTNASGCSIDKSVHFIQEMENNFKVNLFDRMQLAFKPAEEVIAFPMAQLNEQFAAGVINEGTTFFNNTVQTLAALQTNWQVAVGESWLAARLKKEGVKP